MGGPPYRRRKLGYTGKTPMGDREQTRKQPYRHLDFWLPLSRTETKGISVTQASIPGQPMLPGSHLGLSFFLSLLLGQKFLQGQWLDLKRKTGLRSVRAPCLKPARKQGLRTLKHLPLLYLRFLIPMLIFFILLRVSILPRFKIFSSTRR